ncbi:MAG: hypothetical protein PHV30_07420 [Candidatus Margulisbacteria bacterium]|nr:hypothetical protein [Candidatus Margulisiibacteriota bacterium]
MKTKAWQIILVLALLLLSFSLFVLHYFIFNDLKYIFSYLLYDIAFIPIQILIVSLIIEKIISTREKKSVLNKMNMAIGIFFSEVGASLLEYFANMDPEVLNIRKKLSKEKDWTEKEFKSLVKELNTYNFQIHCISCELEDLHKFLSTKKDFLLHLLENGNLLEHDNFTDLLWSVFHLVEELSHRQKIETITEADKNHLVADVKRAYKLLMMEWLAYMKHLKSSYPYMFSLAIRTNPFDPNASVEIKS